jgi:Domain of unknown function (DUF397)
MDHEIIGQTKPLARISANPPNGRGEEGGTGLPAVVWKRSSTSMANGNCVEVACLPDGRIAVRDSKDMGGPVLCFTREEWQNFLDGIQGTRFRTS